MYDDPWKLRVAVFGYASGAAPLAVAWRLVNCPNRVIATTNGHRSAAQNGQYSAPT